MSLFFGGDYYKPQYFNVAYLHGATAVQDGRSGYWRLFYTNLQEEHLNQPEEKGDDEVPEKKVTFKLVESFEPVVVPATPKRKSTKREEVKVTERPVLRAVEAKKLPDIQPILFIMSAEFHKWALQIEPLRVQMLATKAANDEDEEEIELLLLAA